MSENLGKWGSAPGKQNLRLSCPTNKVEFRYFSSPEKTPVAHLSSVYIQQVLNEKDLGVMISSNLYLPKVS